MAWNIKSVKKGFGLICLGALEIYLRFSRIYIASDLGPRALLSPINYIANGLKETIYRQDRLGHIFRALVEFGILNVEIGREL